MVVVLAAMLTAGQAYAGWGGGGRRSGGWYGPQLEQGIQGNTGEQGPWMQRRGPGRGRSEAEAWQGGPGRGLGGGQRMGRNWESRFNSPVGPEARFGRGNRSDRGFQGGNVGPRGRGWGPRAEMMQRRPMRGNRGQGFQGGRNGRGFRGGAGLPGRGAWNGPHRGLQGRHFGPSGRNFEQTPMLQRGPWGGNRGQGPRSGVGMRRDYRGRGLAPQGPGPRMQRGPIENNQGQGYGPGRGGRGFQREETPEAQGQGPRSGVGMRRDYRGRGLAPQGPGPRMQRGPIENNQGQGYGPGRGGRGFQREETPEVQEQGRGFGRTGRDDRTFPRLRGGRGREGRPGLRRGPGGPAERPGVEGSDAAPEAPTDANNPKEEPPADEEV